MSVVCPRGHESQATDYCDQCGALIAGAITAVLPVVEEVDTSPAARREPCPACGAARSGEDRYCESCGYDFHGPPPAPAGWEAIVSADRVQFDRLAVDGVSFPADYSERRVVLGDGESRIGRSRGHPEERAPRSTWRRRRSTRASPACTPCSSAAPTGGSWSATSARPTGR